jgi:vWA-MoxR associated protein C-terminal domain/vWA-MoxR associated protein middle region 0/Effector-associated domain 2
VTTQSGAGYSSSLTVLIGWLEQIPSLRDPASRRLCLELLGKRLGAELVVDELPTMRTQLIGIVEACRRQHPRALHVLMEVLEHMESGSIPVKRAQTVVDNMAVLDLLPEKGRQELLVLIEGCPGEQLGEFLRLSAGPTVDPMPGEPRPADALAALEHMNARPDGLPPLLVFVEYLAAYFSDQRGDLLRQWNDRQADWMGLTEKLRAERRTELTRPTVPKDVDACLVIRIEPDMLDPDILTVTHWRHSDPLEWRPQRGESVSGDLAAARQHVAELILQAEISWAKDARAIQVEFLLPRSLLNVPVDQWDLENESTLPRPLGLHYPVVVRSLERARSPQWHREWRRRWAVLKQLSHVQPTPEEYWMWSGGTRSRHLTVLDAKLAVNKDVVSLVLRSAPKGTEEGELTIGLRTGVPVMLWHRSDTGRAAFEQEVKAMSDALPELIENLQKLRSRARQAARPGTHVGSRMSLLWDDPDRLVEPLGPPAAPVEEVPA